jgi:hypothetical protein
MSSEEHEESKECHHKVPAAYNSVSDASNLDEDKMKQASLSSIGSSLIFSSASGQTSKLETGMASQDSQRSHLKKESIISFNVSYDHVNHSKIRFLRLIIFLLTLVIGNKQ